MVRAKLGQSPVPGYYFLTGVRIPGWEEESPADVSCEFSYSEIRIIWVLFSSWASLGPERGIVFPLLGEDIL